MSNTADMVLLVVSIHVKYRGQVREIEEVVSDYMPEGHVILERWGEQGVCAFRVKTDYLQEVKEKFSPQYYLVEQRPLPAPESAT